jgi:hypothetical protein
MDPIRKYRLSHKREKKRRKIQKEVDCALIKLEPIVMRALAELGGDQEKFENWACVAGVLMIENENKPIEECLPSRLKMAVRPPAVIGPTNEYRP